MSRFTPNILLALSFSQNTARRIIHRFSFCLLTVSLLLLGVKSSAQYTKLIDFAGASNGSHPTDDIHTGISPNGNGQNDVWVIQYINVLSDTKENHVSVFNRWGDEVFETSNYDNVNRVFRGLNKNGSELGSGTLKR